MMGPIMAKQKIIYTCQQCGAQRPRWEGRCSDCGAWNSLVEESATQDSTPGRGWALGKNTHSSEKAHHLDEALPQANQTRVALGYPELDRLLGGGLVRGSYTLVGGDPGIGKSTLLLQLSGQLARLGLKIHYVSAEESVAQTALRAQRLQISSHEISVSSESRLEAILNRAQTDLPDVLIVDSIQTVYWHEIPSAPGSVSQVRECAGRLMVLAKNLGITVFVIGHVTKDGSLAGPRVLEHMVDTVLSFEGDSNYHFRMLRALKNRFGATNELAVFEMSSAGLQEVTNPSQFFLEEREGQQMGSAVFASIEGSRPILCEIQALVSSSPLAMPRRTTLGADSGRVQMILAVLDKYLHAETSRSDVYVNVVGGLKLQEPAADLATAAAILSSVHETPLSRRNCYIGELGLTGEVRAVTFAEERIKEALKLGFAKVFIPAANKKHVSQSIMSQIQLTFVESIRDLEKRSTPTRPKGQVNLNL